MCESRCVTVSGGKGERAHGDGDSQEVTLRYPLWSS